MNTDTCYTMPLVPSGHFRVLSKRKDSCTVISENGLKLHGVKKSDLRTCNCGRWRWPKKESVKR